MGVLVGVVTGDSLTVAAGVGVLVATGVGVAVAAEWYQSIIASVTAPFLSWCLCLSILYAGSYLAGPNQAPMSFATGIRPAVESTFFAEKVLGNADLSEQQVAAIVKTLAAGKPAKVSASLKLH